MKENKKKVPSGRDIIEMLESPNVMDLVNLIARANEKYDEGLRVRGPYLEGTKLPLSDVRGEWGIDELAQSAASGKNVFGRKFQEGGMVGGRNSMPFINELMKGPGTEELGITYEEPKAHDKMDSLLDDERLNQVVKDLVLGLTGGGKGKGIKELMLLMKGKIKGGKMIPSQPFRQGMVGKPSGQRHSSMISGENPFWGKYGKGKLSEYKELANEYDAVGLAWPERADEIFSIFQKQFGNKNASRVIDNLLGQSNPSKLGILLNKLKDNPNVGGNIKAVMKENVKRYKK